MSYTITNTQDGLCDALVAAKRQLWEAMESVELAERDARELGDEGTEYALGRLAAWLHEAAGGAGSMNHYINSLARITAQVAHRRYGIEVPE